MQVKDLKGFDFRSICPLSSALDIIGDKWTLLILRDIVFFKKNTFSQFADSDEGIATNILSNRLKMLMDLDLLEKTSHPSNKKTILYQLTQKGEDFIPVMLELIVWSSKHLDDHVAKESKGFAEMYLRDRDTVVDNFRA